MRGRWIALLLFLAAQPAAAERAYDLGVIRPPLRYNHMPTIPVVLFRPSPEKVAEICAQWIPAGHDIVRGCAFITALNTCHVFIRRDIGLSHLFWYSWHHELAHCNGWPADHPE